MALGSLRVLLSGETLSGADEAAGDDGAVVQGALAAADSDAKAGEAGVGVVEVPGGVLAVKLHAFVGFDGDGGGGGDELVLVVILDHLSGDTVVGAEVVGVRGFVVVKGYFHLAG